MRAPRVIPYLDREGILVDTYARHALAVLGDHGHPQIPLGHGRLRIDQRLAQIPGAAPPPDTGKIRPGDSPLASDRVAGCAGAFAAVNFRPALRVAGHG